MYEIREEGFYYLIMLGANSVSQIRFVHYDIIRDIILNSPKPERLRNLIAAMLSAGAEKTVRAFAI